MSEIIDRGADAMRAKRRELIAQPLERIWPELMRAAIEAMREPTASVLDAGFQKSDDFGYLSDNDDVAAVWRAMIDAAREAPAPIPHDGSTTSAVKDSLTTGNTTQEKT